MKRLLIVMMGILLVGSFASTAAAVTIDYGPDNVGITAFSYSVSGTNITIYETWGAVGYGFLEITGLTGFTNYSVTKYITNNTGTDWISFSNELLDPAGDGNDATYDDPISAWVPTGYSHSNEMDGLSFAQGQGIPRTSTAFSSIAVDELAGRDFIDFIGGSVSGSGGIDTITFGLRDNQVLNNEPFLLAERPNELVVSVPEPATLILLGVGLVGVGTARRKFKK